MVLPNTNMTNPTTIITIKIIVFNIDISFKYITDFLLLPLKLYTWCSPFVKANNPLSADNNTNINEMETVPNGFWIYFFNYS